MKLFISSEKQLRDLQLGIFVQQIINLSKNYKFSEKSRSI